jgi:ribosomal protein L39E
VSTETKAAFWRRKEVEFSAKRDVTIPVFVNAMTASRMINDPTDCPVL